MKCISIIGSVIMKAVMPLKTLHSFAIDVLAHRVVTAYTEQELFSLWRQYLVGDQPVLLLGGGSNVLFMEDYAGTVILNRIRGIDVSEDHHAWHLHVGAGEVWHDLVKFCLDHNMPGLENLAFIPGYVGSAPIKNIGAYGVELQHVCEYVDVIELKQGNKIRIRSESCQFDYRDSIFKRDFRKHFAIVAVGIRLNKVWKPVLTYSDLTKLDIQCITPRHIYDTVFKMRYNTLPDPEITGNAGSFFKNPLIPSKYAERFLQGYPEVPHYFMPDGRLKLSAGWLIDQCRLKGYQIGGAAVCNTQALVLINTGEATGREIAELAQYIRHKVATRFSVLLEPEVHLILARGEVDAFDDIL